MSTILSQRAYLGGISHFRAGFALLRRDFVCTASQVISRGSCSCDGVKREESLIYAGTCYGRGASIILKEPDRVIKTRSARGRVHPTGVPFETARRSRHPTKIPKSNCRVISSLMHWASLPRKRARTSTAPQKPPNLLCPENRREIVRRETARCEHVTPVSRSHQDLRLRCSRSAFLREQSRSAYADLFLPLSELKNKFANFRSQVFYTMIASIF